MHHCVCGAWPVRRQTSIRLCSHWYSLRLHTKMVRPELNLFPFGFVQDIGFVCFVIVLFFYIWVCISHTSYFLLGFNRLCCKERIAYLQIAIPCSPASFLLIAKYQIVTVERSEQAVSPSHDLCGEVETTRRRSVHCGRSEWRGWEFIVKQPGVMGGGGGQLLDDDEKMIYVRVCSEWRPASGAQWRLRIVVGDFAADFTDILYVSSW